MSISKMAFISMLITILSTAIYAEDKKVEYLGLFSMKETLYMVGEGEDALEINRVMTPCAKNKGFFQPFVPVKGINPVTESEMLRALNDKDAVVVDMRVQEQYFKGTIPTAINIPYGDIELRMDELGCSETKSGWDCSKAVKVYGFCNGPVCVQSPTAMKVMIKNGFPAEKIYYYRGGMLAWSALGLTTVPGEF